MVALGPIAACGGGDDDDSSATTTTTAAGGVATTPTSAGVPSSAAPTVLPATTALPIPDASGYTQEPAEGALRQGMKGLRVQALQAKLLTLGYDAGTADGLFGAQDQGGRAEVPDRQGPRRRRDRRPAHPSRAGLAQLEPPLT